MGRPLNKKNFGAGAGKMSVKFYDGSSVVTGYIVKQVGSRKFKVSKADGSGQKICRLATSTAELALLTAGTALAGVSRADLCTIEVVIFNGGATENIKSISMNKTTTVQGTTVKARNGVTASANGQGTLGGVAQIAMSVANAIPDGVATVAGAYSYVIPANTFAGGNGTLTYSMNTVAGFSFNAATRTVSKAAGASTAGTKTITITATDEDGTTASDSYDVVVS